jgi:hypothetical protein
VKIKLDENLPHRLVPLLTELGHDVDTVPDEQLAGQDDGVVWEAAQSHGRFITQDLDFSDARKYVPGAHHGLLLGGVHGNGDATQGTGQETIPLKGAGRSRDSEGLP